MEDKFLMQLVREPNREGTPLDLLFAKRKGLLCDEKIGGCLGHGDPEMIALSILTEVRRGISRTATLDFQRADLGLFRRPVERVTWEAVLKTEVSRKAGHSSRQKSSRYRSRLSPCAGG